MAGAHLGDPLSSQVQGFIDVNIGRSGNPLLFFQLTQFDDNLGFGPWYVVMFAWGISKCGLGVCLDFKPLFRPPDVSSVNGISFTSTGKVHTVRLIWVHVCSFVLQTTVCIAFRCDFAGFCRNPGAVLSNNNWSRGAQVFKH